MITPVHIVNTVFLVLVQTQDAFALLPRSSYIARGRSQNVERGHVPVPTLLRYRHDVIYDMFVPVPNVESHQKIYIGSILV